MSNLQVMLNEQANLYAEVAAQLGEITEEQIVKQEILDVTIPAKVDGWSGFLKEGIPNQIKKFKEKIQEYKDAIDKLELYKEKKEAYLHNLIKMEQLEQLDGEDTRIVPDISVRRSVDMNKLEEIDGGYEVKGWIPADMIDRFKEFVSPQDISDLLEYTRKCNVTDLPEGHPAIVSKVRPTVKILKQQKRK